MDTIIYLKFKEEKPDPFPVFSIRQRQFENYRLVTALIPRSMPDIARPPGRMRRQSVLSRLLGRPQLSGEVLKTAWIQELAQYLKPYCSTASYSICDDSVERWLRKENLTEWWSCNWPLCEFSAYREWYLAEELMREARGSALPPHFLVLGYDDCVPGLIDSCIRQIKSLRFVLASPSEPLQEYLEGLCEEYGLAASVQLLKQEKRQKGPFYHYPAVCVCPSVILDFSGEEMLLTADTASGSFWLDMDSMEESAAG